MTKMDQEEILLCVQKQNWMPVLNFLYERKEEIKTDSLLQFATNVFESEYFIQMANNSKSINLDDQEKLFILHSGGFFKLKDSNFEILVEHLAQKTKGETSYNYALLFPDNQNLKKIVSKLKVSPQIQDGADFPQRIKNMNWIEVYNRLFEVINNQNDQSTYFSGPRFINTLKEFSPYHPDYTQYINLRNRQGKSTSRRIFYYDILMELDESTRINFINRIIEMVEPFDSERITPIKTLLAGKTLSKNVKLMDSKPKTIEEGVSTVFISYSWDNEDHKGWVLNLANKLQNENVNVLLDRYELRPGKSLTHFVETSIEKADRIVIIFTPNYKMKAEKRAGGVGYEYSIMNADLYNDQTGNEKIIPIIRNGSTKQSIPKFMQQYIHIDMRNDENYETSYTDLLREIYNEPEIVKPELGKKRKLD